MIDELCLVKGATRCQVGRTVLLEYARGAGIRVEYPKDLRRFVSFGNYRSVKRVREERDLASASEMLSPKIRSFAATMTTTMSFTEREMQIFGELKAVLGCDRMVVMRMALRDYARKSGVDIRDVGARSEEERR